MNNKTYGIVSNYFILRDEAEKENFSKGELEMYFYDLYHLFLRTLTDITHDPELSTDKEARLQHMLDELLRTKRLLADPTSQ